MIPFLGLNAQGILELDADTMYCITINYFSNADKEPETHTFLLPIHENCYVNISNHDTLIKSMSISAYSISDLYFSLFPMIKASFPDSSLAFQKDSFNSSITKWVHFNLKSNESKKFYTKNDDFFIIHIAKVIAIAKHNVNGFPLAISIIKDIIPVSLSDDCIKDNLMIISESVLHDIEY